MKKASIKDVAKEAGVSITTVSRALNGYNDVSEATKEKIFKVVERLNYAPNMNARALGGISVPTLALLVSGLKKREDSGFVFGMISGLYHTSLENNCEFILLTTNGAKQREVNYIQLCRQMNISGVMISGLRIDDPYYIELVNSEIPCVIVDADITGKKICTLSIDNLKASYDAVKYLLDKGHRHIGMMNGSASAEVSKYRFSGYAKALQEESILLDLSYMYYSDFLEEAAYKNTIDLLIKNPQITAIFCASDVMAVGAIKAINNFSKKVPEDISIVGFDDIPAAPYVNGGLTTIRQDPFLMGKYSGEALIHMIKNKESMQHISLEYTLIERNTVKIIEQ